MWANKWWVVIRGDKRGPMTLAELVAIVETREVEARTFVWTTGFGPWIRAGQVETFKTLWAALPPEAPRRPPTAQSARPAAVAPIVTSEAQAAREPTAAVAQPVPGADASGAPEAAPVPPASQPVVANPPTGSGVRPRLHLRSIPPPPLPPTGASPRPATPTEPLRDVRASGPAAVVPTAAVPSVATPAASPAPFDASAPIERNIFGEAVSPVAATLLMRADDLVHPDGAAASPSPELSSARGVVAHADGHHEDAFFAGGTATGAGTSTPGRSASGPGVDLIDLKHVLDELKNADGGHIAPIGTSPTGFSMVTRLHRPDKKRWLIPGAVVALLGAAAAIVIAVQPPADPTPKAQAPVVAPRANSIAAQPAKPPESAPREDLKTASSSTPELAVPAKVDGAVANGAGASSVASVLPGAKVVKPKGPVDSAKNTVGAAADGANRGLTKEQFAALTEDDVGKQEVKLEFDPGAAARKAADDAAAKQRVAASNLAQDVAGAFGKKKTQFARCSDGSQERVRLVFTVQPTGKVANTHVEGTTNTNKAQCLSEILGRAIFPAGSEPATYSQVMVL